MRSSVGTGHRALSHAGAASVSSATPVTPATGRGPLRNQGELHPRGESRASPKLGQRGYRHWPEGVWDEAEEAAVPSNMSVPGTEIDNTLQMREGEREPSKLKENHQENRHQTGAITLQLQKAASESGPVLPGSPTQPPPQLGEKKSLDGIHL